MKIGILTLPLEINYGGILQAFALQRTLIKMGHNVVTIDRHNRKKYPSLRVHVLGYCKRMFLHYLRGKNVSTKWNPFISESDFFSSSVLTQKFISRNIELTKRIFSDQLVEIDEEYKFDAYVVGSDQIWNANYCPDSFLGYVKRDGVKKVVYAASCGNKSFFKDSYKVSISKELAKHFAGISVREKSLIELCKREIAVDVQWVLDPTLLLSKEEYLQVTENNVGTEPILFSYILDSNQKKDEIVSSLARTLNLTVVNGNRLNTEGDAAKAYPSVDDWIRNVNRSQFVITDSFHGTVFAILFNKQFMCIGNKKRGLSRFLSLLSIFGLENRLIDESNISNIDVVLKETIDYDIVNNIIDKERQNSLTFLRYSLQ